MRFGFICKFIVLITVLSLLTTLPTFGNDDGCEENIRIKISELSVFDDCRYAVVSADCGDVCLTGLALVLCCDGEPTDAENLCPNSHMTKAYADGRFVLLWDFEKCADCTGYIARIAFDGNIRIVTADAWSDSGRAPVRFESHAEKVYCISERCAGLWLVTQYKKYRLDEYIDGDFLGGCFVAAYDGDYITVGRSIPTAESPPCVPVTDFLKSEYK